MENIITSLSQITDELVFRQPSILILDHFDDLFPNETNITDANIILATQKLALCKSHSISMMNISLSLSSCSRIVRSCPTATFPTGDHSHCQTNHSHRSTIHRRNSTVRFPDSHHRTVDPRSSPFFPRHSISFV